jgi:acyl carrier protein
VDAQFSDLIKSAAELPDSFTVLPEHDLKADLDIDSLRLIDVLLAVEDEFGVELEEDALARIETAGDLYIEIEKVAAA